MAPLVEMVPGHIRDFSPEGRMMEDVRDPGREA